MSHTALPTTLQGVMTSFRTAAADRTAELERTARDRQENLKKLVDTYEKSFRYETTAKRCRILLTNPPLQFLI